MQTTSVNNSNKTKTDTVQQSLRYDTLITNPVAILVFPTLHKLDSMRMDDSLSFYTVADDNQYYMSLSSEYLDSVKANKIARDAKGTIGFKTNTGQIFKRNLDTLYWGIILFNGKSKPIDADILVINHDYESYMK